MQIIRIFDFGDYRQFVRKKLQSLPKKGRGQLQRLAAHINVHPTLVSQVLRGDKNFTSEQACSLADFFGLQNLEFEYLLGLVELERAGNQTLKKYWREKIDHILAEQTKSTSRIASFTSLDGTPASDFYSSWEYSGIRLSTSIGRLKTIEDISNRLGIPVVRVQEILNFLLETGLCKQENDRISMGPSRTHVRPDSPLNVRHQINWRMKALQMIGSRRAHELNYSMPLTISYQDREKVKALLLETIGSVASLVDQSGSDELCCLTIDWFDVRKASID